jgi:hypothetical protein
MLEVTYTKCMKKISILKVIMPCVIMLSAIMLSVVAPFQTGRTHVGPI